MGLGFCPEVGWEVWVHLLLVVVALLWNVALVLTARLGH
jgi:hypothetical protein